MSASDRSQPDVAKLGRQLLLGWCTSLDTLNAEIIARSGVDIVCVDGQHGAKGWTDVLRVVQVLSASGVTTLVRVPELDAVSIGHALDCGSDGVIVPFVETAEQAAFAVNACRYPPLGERSWGPSRSSVLGRKVSSEVLCVVMIETPAAVHEAKNIAAVEGVSAVVVGSRDMSLYLGLDPLDDDAMFESEVMLPLIESVPRECRVHGVPVGIPARTSDQARRLRELGYSWLIMPSDVVLLGRAMRESVQAVREQ